MAIDDKQIGDKKSTSLGGKPKFGIFELTIPKVYFPRKKDNQSREFAGKLAQVMEKLHDVELVLELCLINIKNTEKILFAKKRRSNRPINLGTLRWLRDEVERFNYEYENYCLRAYIYREALCKFIAKFLDIRGSEAFHDLVKESKIRSLKLDKVLQRFTTRKNLKDIIEDRNRITHKLPEGQNQVKIGELLNKFGKDNDRVKSSLDVIKKIHKDIAEKINQYKSR